MYSSWINKNDKAITYAPWGLGRKLLLLIKKTQWLIIVFFAL